MRFVIPYSLRMNGMAVGSIMPSVILVLLFVYGFAAWTAYISLSASRMVPDFEFVGFQNYIRMWGADRWS